MSLIRFRDTALGWEDAEGKNTFNQRVGEAITNPLAICSSLKSLILNWIRLSSFEDGMVHSTTLKSLTLMQCGIEYNMLPKLVDGLPSLKYFVYDGVPLTVAEKTYNCVFNMPTATLDNFCWIDGLSHNMKSGVPVIYLLLNTGGEEEKIMYVALGEDISVMELSQDKFDNSRDYTIHFVCKSLKSFTRTFCYDNTSPSVTNHYAL
jgi:hypothetical protein